MARQEEDLAIMERIYQEVKARVDDVVLDHDRSGEGWRDEVYEDGATDVGLVEQLIGKYDQLVKRNKELGDSTR